MTKEEIINDITNLIELCESGINHEAIHCNFANEYRVAYLNGYIEAMKTHITNLIILRMNIEGKK